MSADPYAEFEAKRKQVIEQLSSTNAAAAMKMTEAEKKASVKWEELKGLVKADAQLDLFADLHKNFAAFQTTRLYKAIKRMPKGVLQHCHLPATLSMDYFLQVMTRHPKVLINLKTKQLNVQTADAPLDPLQNIPVTEYRKQKGNGAVDQEIRAQYLMNDSEIRDVNTKKVFSHFNSRFEKMGSAFFYEPVLAEFVRRLVEELKADGVQAAEVRNVCFMLIKEDGSSASVRENAAFYQRMKEEAAKGGFSLNWIHTGIKEESRDPTIVKKWMEIAETAYNTPELRDTFCGVDMVDYEGNFLLHDMHRALIDLKQRCPGINLILHAGESTDKENWNMVDAVLLGSKRLGHGINFANNPAMAGFLKEHGVCVEVNIVSNFMLAFMRDPFWHPLRSLINLGVPCALSSDDCLFWDVAPLTMDFFVAVVYCDLTLAEVKWLIGNSIRHSYFPPERRELLAQEFAARWDCFVDTLAAEPHQAQA